jgi:hypothetical protein
VLLISFYEVNITLLPKADNDFTRKEQEDIAHEYRHKNPQEKH